MKNTLLFFAFFLCAFSVTAQVTTNYFEGKDAFQSLSALRQSKSQILSAKRMPSIDIGKLLEEDRITEEIGGFPFRFGQGFDVNYTLKDGLWDEYNSQRIWTLKIVAPGAYSVNFIFDELYLPPGAELYIFNTEGSMVYGPVTEKQNLEEGIFLTDLVAGEEVIIQISEPIESNEKSILNISRVVHAYKNLFPFFSETGTRATTYSCHNDVACHPAWAQESDGVALILLSNATSMCTGSLLHNTAQDFRPYILTAFHCINTEISNGCSPNTVLSSTEISNAENWMFRFGFKKTTCGASATSSTATYNRAYFRAGWFDTDFALMELRTPINSDKIKFLGWDRSGNPPIEGTVIHHPAGDPMKISFDHHSPVLRTTSYTVSCYPTIPANTLWTVGLDSGTTEGCSSGSPLFDVNQRVIGQLLGGDSGCPVVNKYFGRLQQSWTGGGTNATSLHNWLAPGFSSSSAPNTLDGRYPPAITGSNHICSGSSNQFSATNWQPGYYWDKSNNLINISNTSVYNPTISAASSSSNGAVTLSVKNSSGTTLSAYDVWVGAPTTGNINGPSPLQAGSPNGFYTINHSGGTNTIWSSSIVPGSSSSYHFSNGSEYYVTYSASCYPTITAQVSNLCGSSYKYFYLTVTGQPCTCGNSPPYCNCNPWWSPSPSPPITNHGTICNTPNCTCNSSLRQSLSFHPFPNPASDLINLKINTYASKAQTFDVRLYDGQGNLLRQTVTTGGTVQFNVSKLPDGIYYLHIYDGVNSKPVMQHIVIQH